MLYPFKLTFFCLSVYFHIHSFPRPLFVVFFLIDIFPPYPPTVYRSAAELIQLSEYSTFLCDVGGLDLLAGSGSITFLLSDPAPDHDPTLPGDI